MECLYEYINHPYYKPYKSLIYSKVCNVGKKSNYKKFAKRMKKAVKYLPPELEVEIRVTRSN